MRQPQEHHLEEIHSQGWLLPHSVSLLQQPKGHHRTQPALDSPAPLTPRRLSARRAAATPYVQLLYTSSTKQTSQSLFFSPLPSKKHGKAWEGAEAQPAMPADPSSTGSWRRFGRLWEFVRQQRGSGAALREVRTAALSELIPGQKERKGGRHRSLMRHL